MHVREQCGQKFTCMHLDFVARCIHSAMHFYISVRNYKVKHTHDYNEVYRSITLVTYLIMIFLQTNTYQGIIITDKVNTYYVFTYICGELQWSVGSGFDHAVVGYNSHGDYFYNTPGSGYENIADIVSCSFQVGNRRIRNTPPQESMQGVLPYNTPNPVEMCSDKIDTDRNSISDDKILHILEILPDCPPTLHLVQVDHLFEPDSTKAACFRSKIQVNPANIGAHVQRPYIFVH